MKRYKYIKSIKNTTGTGHYFAVDDSTITRLETTKDIDKEINLLKSDNYHYLDIDKSWQGLFSLLYKDSIFGFPANNLVIPIIPLKKVSQEKYIYFLSSKEVQTIYGYLLSIDESNLKKKFNFNEFIKENIYPLKKGDDEEFYFDYLLEYLDAIKRFYKKAIKNDLGLVFYIE